MHYLTFDKRLPVYMRRPRLTNSPYETIRTSTKPASFDFVEWPVESSAPIHVLSPSPHFLHMDGTLLVAFNLFSLCRLPSSSHDFHLTGFHPFSISLFYVGFLTF